MSTYIDKIGAYSPYELATIPTFLVADSVTATTAVINWQNNNANVLSIQVQKWNGSAWEYVNSLSNTALTYFLTDLLPETTYKYRVVNIQFIDGENFYFPSYYIQFTTSAGPTPPPPQSYAPTNLAQDIQGANWIHFTFTPNCDGECIYPDDFTILVEDGTVQPSTSIVFLENDVPTGYILGGDLNSDTTYNIVLRYSKNGNDYDSQVTQMYTTS